MTEKELVERYRAHMKHSSHAAPSSAECIDAIERLTRERDDYRSACDELAAERAKVERLRTAYHHLLEGKPEAWNEMAYALSPSPSPVEGEGEKLNPDIQERDKHRPIQVHCLGLLIQKATGCGDNAAITAAYQAWDFCGHPVCCGSAIDQDELARAFVVKYDQAAPLRESPAQQAGTGELADVLTKRRITHDEAREAVQRLVNSHFHQEPKGRFGIPARPDYDDDLVLHAYIEQQLASPAARDAALEEAIRRTRTRLEHYCNEANAGRMPSDAREFMRRIQCGFDSLFEEACTLRSRQQGE